MKISSNGSAKLSLSTVKTDLSAADLVDHFIHTTIEAGTFSAEHMRLWGRKGSSLKPAN